MNHNGGDLQRALAMIASRRRAGADTVKFQTFRTHGPGQRHAHQGRLPTTQRPTGESQLAMLQRLTLDFGTQFLPAPNTARHVASISCRRHSMQGVRLSPRTPATAAHQARLGRIDQCPAVVAAGHRRHRADPVHRHGNASMEIQNPRPVLSGDGRHHRIRRRNAWMHSTRSDCTGGSRSCIAPPTTRAHSTR